MLIHNKSWIYETILKDIQTYNQEVFTIDNLREVFYETFNSNKALISIRGNHVTCETGRRTEPLSWKIGKLSHTIDSIKRAIRYKPPIETAFIFDYADLINDDENYPEIPIFGICKRKSSKGILIPDNALERTHSRSKQHSKEFPWEKKMAKGYFLGATTGERMTSANLFDQPRIKLVKLSKEYPELLDAKFSIYISGEFDEEVARCTFLEEFKVYPKASLKEISKYKYVIDVDGITNSWIRSRYALSSNSLTVKHKTPFCQWFYSGVTEGVHFLEVERNFSDIVEKIQWAEETQDECKEMIKNASKFADEYLTTKAQLEYLYQAMDQYAKLFKVIF